MIDESISRPGNIVRDRNQAMLGAVMGRHQIKELFEQPLPAACVLFMQRLSRWQIALIFSKQGENQVFDNFPDKDVLKVAFLIKSHSSRSVFANLRHGVQGKDYPGP